MAVHLGEREPGSSSLLDGTLGDIEQDHLVVGDAAGDGAVGPEIEPLEARDLAEALRDVGPQVLEVDRSALADLERARAVEVDGGIDDPAGRIAMPRIRARRIRTRRIRRSAFGRSIRGPRRWPSRAVATGGADASHVCLALPSAATLAPAMDERSLSWNDERGAYQGRPSNRAFHSGRLNA